MTSFKHDKEADAGGQTSSEMIQEWIARAYREPDDPSKKDALRFSRWNMEIAYRAGIEAARRAMLASAPASPQEADAGWQLVPKEPTPEMLGAWYRYKSGFHFHDEPAPTDTSDVGAYQAMLASAPASPPLSGHGVVALKWDETFTDRGDGSKDPAGWEADSGFGSWYEIRMYFGSDSYGWEVIFDYQEIGDFDDPEAAKEAAQADFAKRVRAALSTAPSAPVQDAESSLESRVSEQLAEGGGLWRTCTGCYDSVDGHPVGEYPHSDVFGCTLGSGCRECGGIGAVWDDTDFAGMVDWLFANDPAAPVQDAGIVEALKTIKRLSDDIVVYSHDNSEATPTARRIADLAERALAALPTTEGHGEMEIAILRSAAGEVVTLPYNEEQAKAERRLCEQGLIQSEYIDDQPTKIITPKGRAALRNMEGRGAAPATEVETIDAILRAWGCLPAEIRSHGSDYAKELLGKATRAARAALATPQAVDGKREGKSGRLPSLTVLRAAVEFLRAADGSTGLYKVRVHNKMMTAADIATEISSAIESYCIQQDEKDEETFCTCGAGHGSLQDHIEWCAWLKLKGRLYPPVPSAVDGKREGES